MGMFDYIRCEAELPGTTPTFVDKNHLFQTKDLPDMYLSKFVIESDGSLVREESKYNEKEYLDFTGTVEFYTSNIVASGPGIYTSDGEDQESVEYKAVFFKGKLDSIEQTSYERKPALPSSKCRHMYEKETEEEKERRLNRRDETLVGKEMTVWRGGDITPPYQVKVVYDGKDKWCVVKEDGTLELIDRWSRDVTFFDSMEDGKKYKDERNAKWAAGKKEYDDLLEKAKKTT